MLSHYEFIRHIDAKAIASRHSPSVLLDEWKIQGKSISDVLCECGQHVFVLCGLRSPTSSFHSFRSMLFTPIASSVCVRAVHATYMPRRMRIRV